jgi:hypothetical protein
MHDFDVSVNAACEAVSDRPRRAAQNDVATQARRAERRFPRSAKSSFEYVRNRLRDSVDRLGDDSDARLVQPE